MEEKVNFAVVGIFVLVLSAGIIGGVLWFSSGKSYLKVYDTYLTYMSDSVAGLNLDAPVRYRGVEIGRVKNIALAPGNVEQVQLTLDIERGSPVKVDTVAVLRVQGLTGLAFVELTGGSRDSAPLKALAGEEYPVIRAEPSLVALLETRAMTLINNLNRSSENFNALMDEDNRRMVKNTLADLELLSRTIAARSATIDSSLANAARTMENTARLTKELPLLAQRLQRSADTFDQMTSEFARAGANANRTLDDTRQFTSQTLPEARLMVSELRELSSSLRRFSAELEQNPSVLIYGKPALPRGPGE